MLLSIRHCDNRIDEENLLLIGGLSRLTVF